MRFLSLLLFFLVPSFILALYDLISAAALLDAHFRLGIQTLQLSSKKSSVVSLFSILTSLGALNTGLEGKASEEITEKIFNGMDKKKVNDWLYSWYTDESMALKIYFDKNVTVKEEFLYKMFRYYFTDTENVDFTSNAENLRQEINEFVENKTAGHFREFYAPGATFEKTQALMVNAIHMEKKWPLPFEAEKNRKDVFYGEGRKGWLERFYGKARKETFMTNNISFSGSTSILRKTDEFTYAEITFDERWFRFFILMPPENQTLSELAEKFINKRLGFTEMSFWNDAVSRRKVFGCCLNITLPKFKAKSTFKLRTVLEKLGVETLFKNADFSGITNSPIQISDILHKAKIDVNEEGFSAPIPKVPREQWWGDCKNCKTERSIVANRPFFYGVLHNSIPKFIGQYY